MATGDKKPVVMEEDLLKRAAPAGYGYGDEMFDARAYQDTDGSVFESILETLLQGLHAYTSKQVRFFSYPAYVGTEGVGTLSKPTDNNNYAVFYGTCCDGSAFQKYKYNGVWQPLEWLKPPLVHGVEYRTTERYNGKPVYVKSIRYPGVLPASGFGQTILDTLPIDTTEIIDIDVTIKNSATYEVQRLPTVSQSGAETAICHMLKYDDYTDYAFRITVFADMSEWECKKAVVRYTKTTD